MFVEISLSPFINVSRQSEIKNGQAGGKVRYTSASKMLVEILNQMLKRSAWRKEHQNWTSESDA